ncbi:MAG: hypothetical protein WBM03_05440 [Steroidobacteraceae bacterium]
MTIETEDDVAALNRIGKIVAYVLQDMLGAAEPGMTTLELDSLGGQLLAWHVDHHRTLPLNKEPRGDRAVRWMDPGWSV